MAFLARVLKNAALLAVEAPVEEQRQIVRQAIEEFIRAELAKLKPLPAPRARQAGLSSKAS